MKTYQDLLSATDKGSFCVNAVAEFRASAECKQARDGEAYYNNHNLTIEQFQKMIRTVTGNLVKDIFSASYKLKTGFFRRIVMQQVQYVLKNGVNFEKDETSEQLGHDFDFRLQELAKLALAGGQAFGFWNVDHLEVFGFADTDSHPGFCPLYDEQTAELKGGIRYWMRRVGDKTIFRYTLYEPDGYTEYRKVDSERVVVLEEKRAYIQTILSTEADGVEGVIGENYSALPIVPMYGNDKRESELYGIRECIDCYDYIKSGLANDIDDTSGFYWVIKNSGGMDDIDLARFIQRMKTVRAATVDEDQSAEARTLDVPVEARRTMLELLRKDIYEDFQALDVSTLSAAPKTAQEIQAAYQAQDNKCADFEYYILHFVRHILKLAGIDDKPSLVWNKITNQSEQTSMILNAANFISPECVIKKLPFLTADESRAEIEKYQAEEHNRFNDDEEDDYKVGFER